MTDSLNKKPRNFFAEWNVREIEEANNAPVIEKLLKSVTQRVFVKSDHKSGNSNPHY